MHIKTANSFFFKSNVLGSTTNELRKVSSPFDDDERVAWQIVDPSVPLTDDYSSVPPAVRPFESRSVIDSIDRSDPHLGA